jgi:hypothetical protein
MRDVRLAIDSYWRTERGQGRSLTGAHCVTACHGIPAARHGISWRLEGVRVDKRPAQGP